jgi:hypothetical protein
MSDVPKGPGRCLKLEYEACREVVSLLSGGQSEEDDDY